MDTKLLSRKFITHDNQVGEELLPRCDCTIEHRRGYNGGVCGNCGNAIPTLQELNDIKSKK